MLRFCSLLTVFGQLDPIIRMFYPLNIKGQRVLLIPLPGEFLRDLSSTSLELLRNISQFHVGGSILLLAQFQHQVLMQRSKGHGRTIAIYSYWKKKNMQIRPICNANSPSNIPWDGHGVMITQKHTMCCLNFGISNDVLGSAQVVAMGTPMKDLQPREGLDKLIFFFSKEQSCMSDLLLSVVCFSCFISHAALTGQNLVPKICNSWFRYSSWACMPQI